MQQQEAILAIIERMAVHGEAPEVACREHPELLPVVSEQWIRIRSMQRALDELFPPVTSVVSGRAAERIHQQGGEPGSLPQIPGYDVQSQLGMGGAGVVYKARHLSLGRTVAIKMLRAGPYAARHELDVLKREAEAVARLRHENIVQIFDFGEAGGQPYFSMEFVEGGTLSSRLAGSPMPSTDAAKLGAVVASAVECAHRNQIVHRDLKPANILLAVDGTPKIADFGLARCVAPDQTMTYSAARVGTPSYMAPEQVAGRAEAYCPAVDVYALGAVLYEMLTGRPPFRGATSEETARQVLAQDPVRPSRLCLSVPQDLETICLKCLEKDPARRYATAEQVAQDLGRHLRGEPITARRAGPVERLGKLVRRRPAESVAVAAVGVALVVLGVAAVSYGLGQARLRQAVMEDLGEADRLQATADWPAARLALARAKGRIGGESGPLLERLASAEQGLLLVSQLDDVRIGRYAGVDRRYRKRLNRQADEQYEVLFRGAGLGQIGTDDAGVCAARVAASPIAVVLLGAVEDWAACAASLGQIERMRWLLDVARRCDPDATAWRQSARDADVWNDPARLAELTRTLPEGERSLTLMVALAERLQALGADDAAFLRRLQQEHPSDFWLNYTLGVSMGMANDIGAIRYLQAAVSIRPGAAAARSSLGAALGKLGKLDEAMVELETAIRLDPTLGSAHANMGNVLRERGQLAEAIAMYRRAISLDPRGESAYGNLGRVLVELGQLEAAQECFGAGMEKVPGSATIRSGYGLLLHRRGRSAEGLGFCAEAVALDPSLYPARLNYGLCLAAVGRVAEASEEFRRAAELAPKEDVVFSEAGSSLQAAGRAAEAEVYLREALRLQPRSAKALLALGMIIGDRGDLDGAIDHFRRAEQFDPKLANASGALGRALMAKGKFDEAITPLERFLAAIDPKDPRHVPVRGFLEECRRRASVPTSPPGR